MTETGAEFFRTAYDMLVVYQDFYNRTNLAGMNLQRQGTPFLIGSYAFDGMYGVMVDKLLSLPDYFLNRPVKIDFIEAGKMIASVLNGDIHVGIDSEAHIRNAGNMFDMTLLKSVPFQAAVGQEHPLYGRDCISIDELLPYLDNSDMYLINDKQLLSKQAFHNNPVNMIRSIGEYTIGILPRLLPTLDNKHMEQNSLAILAETLTAEKTSQLHRIRIENNACRTNYMLFWLRNNTDPDIADFIKHMR